MSALPDVLAAVTLGPEDRLIIVFPKFTHPSELDAAREFVAQSDVAGRVLMVSEPDDVIVLRATKAEGSTVGQCGDRLPPLFGREYAPGESVQSCHLAYGHTGMHSDGETTWTNEGSQKP
jgi:hypothetical protein